MRGDKTGLRFSVLLTLERMTRGIMLEINQSQAPDWLAFACP